MRKIKVLKRKRIRGMAPKPKTLIAARPPVARPTAWLDLFVITAAMVALAAMIVILVNEAWG